MQCRGPVSRTGLLTVCYSGLRCLVSLPKSQAIDHCRYRPVVQRTDTQVSSTWIRVSCGSSCSVPGTSTVPSCSTTLPGGTSDAGRQKEPAASRTAANRRCAAGDPIRMSRAGIRYQAVGGELPLQRLASSVGDQKATRHVLYADSNGACTCRMATQLSFARSVVTFSVSHN